MEDAEADDDDDDEEEDGSPSDSSSSKGNDDSGMADAAVRHARAELLCLSF